MRTRTAYSVAAVTSLALLSGCGAADMTKQASPFANAQGARTVTLSVQSWVGAQANVAVAQYLLEHKLGYRVDTVQVDEVPAWDALSQGRVDAILEDWGHPTRRSATSTTRGRSRAQAASASPDTSAGTSRPTWSSSTPTSPTGRTSTSTPRCSAPPRAAARAS